ncbi:MAG: LysR family transcriptional regulator [Chloroflexota bacterium]|jgi:molybdate transport system regulatory protein|nr:LysR family transcriptional regulator [Chloroflexota bacterium]MDP6508003.1 LysR family transcriptional regulator [Chloroflexota bacterium]MDP6758755.1 LysR family transcriptional regulator [Chloroflexota bacterium]|tara:strand:+ start:246 stop:635 length:390 start_codon:yes stop_codon:yes gene_type:complete
MPKSRESRWRARSKVWLEDDRVVLLSGFRADLLERVDRLGSVSAAARELDLPNRTAWKKLQETEAAAGFPLLISTSGGSGGGASRLTDEARSLLAAFRRVADPVSGLVDERFAAEAGSFVAPPDETDPA